MDTRGNVINNLQLASATNFKTNINKIFVSFLAPCSVSISVSFVILLHVFVFIVFDAVIFEHQSTLKSYKMCVRTKKPT